MVKSSKAARVKAILLVVAVLSPLIIARAAGPDPSVRPEMADVENGTSVIGRWLIYHPKLTPEVLKVAQDSVQEVDPNLPEESQTGQNDIFYKSDVVTSAELAKNSGDEIRKSGPWFKINSIDDIKGISTEGESVPNSRMDQIYLMFHLKPDGKIYDLKTGETVDIYSLEDPYDLESLPELENLKNKREVWQSDADVKKARENEIASIERVLASVPKAAALKADLKKEEAQRKAAEKKLAALENSPAAKATIAENLGVAANVEQIAALKKDVADKKTEELKIAANLKKAEEMEKADKNGEAFSKERSYLIEQNAPREEVSELDKIYSVTSNKRKLLILNVVDDRVNSELRYAMAPSDSKKDEDKEDAGSNTQYPELATAYETSKQKIKESQDKYGAAISDGSDVISQTTEQKRAEVSQKANGGDNAGARESIKDLIHLGNISSDSVVNRLDEIKIIDEMQKVTLEKYAAALKAGESAEYKQDKANGENQRVIEKSKSDAMAQIEQLNADMDVLAGAKVLRLESDEERVAYLNSISAAVAAAKSGIASDDFAEGLAANAENLKDSVLTLQTQAQNRLNGGSEGDKLKRDLEILKIEYQKAVDANDLVKAGQIKLKMNALSKEMSGGGKVAIADLAKNKKEMKAEEEKVAEGLKASAMLPDQKEREAALLGSFPKPVSDALKNSKVKNDVGNLLKLDADLLGASGDKLPPLKAKLETLRSELPTDVLKTLDDPNGKDKVIDLLKIGEEIKVGEAKVLEGQKAGDKLTALKLNEKMLQSGMDSGTLDTLNDVNEKVDEAKELIKDATLVSDVTRVDKIVDEISRSSPMVGAIVANAALKEIEDEIVKKVANGDSVPTALSDAYDKIKGMLDGGLNTAVENMQNESEIMQLVNDFLENSKLSEDEKQALMILLFDELEKHGGSAIYSNLKNRQVTEALKRRNILIIDKFEQPNADLYVPLDRLAEYKKYSYVWEQDCKSASLTKGKSVYKFKDGGNIAESTDISKSGKEKEVAYEREVMTEKAGFISVMCVPQDYVYKTFEVDVEAISGSKYAVMYKSGLETTLESLRKKLSENKEA